jgi:phenylacetate-CoA ligase
MMAAKYGPGHAVWQNRIRAYIAAMLATPELIREAAQAAQLEERLPRWRKVPLYRERLTPAKHRFPEAARRERFHQLPFITKHEMRAGFPEKFLDAGRTLETLLAQELVELEHTSGTSEDRLPVMFGRGWWNEQEECALRLNPLVANILDEKRDARRATITSPACNGLTCPTVWQSRAQRTIENTLFVNLARIPFLLSDAELARMAAEIAEWSPQFLDVDPVHGTRFALYCEQQGIRFPSLRFVLCSYEFVSVVHRRILTRIFGVPVFNLYGSTETGHLLMENPTGEMKPSYDTAFLEVADADEQEVGELIVTTLSNDYMPLLRYRIGDLAQRQERSYGTDYLVHGRARDALRAGDGRRVTTWQVDQCFVGMGGVAHYHLRQSPGGELRLRYVPESNGSDAGCLPETIRRLESLLQATITTEPVATLLPEASGKFRLTCRTPDSVH